MSLGEANECPVCCDKFTSQLRKPVKCPYCDTAACTICTKRYLTESTLDAHCMGCRRAWNDGFLDMNFTKAFRTGAWKKHREDVLMDREVSLLPTRQPRVEATHKRRECEKEMSSLSRQLRALEAERLKIQAVYNKEQRRYTRYDAESRGIEPPAWTLDAGTEKEKKEDKAKFIMKCPDAECRGFLSSAYKCGTCQMWACPDCLEIKGANKDAEHTCSEERKQSVALILKESKPCPKCGERISKISGCDQMFCVECNTAFSWTTGQAVNGVIHNPHYYEYLRKMGNGVAPRNAGDVPCGGVPYYHHLQNAIVTRATSAQLNTIMAIHRITSEIADQRIHNYQTAFNQNDNGDLGVLYLMKQIEKEDMKRELVKRENKRYKHLAIRAVLEMFVTTSTMILNNIVNNAPKNTKEVETILDEFRNLKKYVNESLMLVSQQKSCSVPQIGVSQWDKPKKETDTVIEWKTWSWVPFNKVGPVKKVVKEKVQKVEQKEEDVETVSDDETDSLIEDVIAETAAAAAGGGR